MDLGASIWLSSVTGALLFFSGGRLWGKAVARREVLALPAHAEDSAPKPQVSDDGAALAQAEQDAGAAREACARMAGALEGERAKVTGLQGQLATAEKRMEELRYELAVARARAEDAAWLGTENVALRREVEERRLSQARLADVQRQSLELATQTHLVERRRSEIAGKEAEHDALRREVEKLSSQAREVEELRAKVRDLTARGFALSVRTQGPVLHPARPAKAGQKLEEAIEVRLDELRRRRGSCQTAVLADVRGLLLASCGDATHDEALAAAASMITETSERMRQLLPLGETLEVRLMDVNHAEFTARWLRDDDQERFLVGTLGMTREKADPRADAIETSISDLLRAPALPSPHVPA